MTQQLSCDVVVVGAGIAGLVAGVRLASGGKRVLVLEKQSADTYVCNTRMTSAAMHCCSMALETPPAQLHAALIGRTGGEGRADLAEAVIADGLRVVDFFVQQGVDLRHSDEYPTFAHTFMPPALIPEGYSWKDRGGDRMMRIMEARLQALGSRLLRGHAAERLLMHGAQVVGCAGKVNEVEAFAVHAEAVVLAGGGFEANMDMLKANGVSPQPDRLFPRNSGAATGDSLRMALDVGAAQTRLGGFYGHVLSRSAFDNPKLWPFPYLDPLLQAGVLVGPDGRRFTDEGMGGTYAANAIAALPDPASSVVIVDERIWKERGTGNPPPPYAPNPDLPHRGGEMHVAPSIEELAVKAGLPVRALKEEIDRYNSAVWAGATHTLTPARSAKVEPWSISQGPFYAFPAAAGITYTMDGISINAACEVLDDNAEPIAGLYAAGCATGGLEGGSRKGYVNGLLKSSVTGLRAAEQILGVLPSPSH